MIVQRVKRNVLNSFVFAVKHTLTTRNNDSSLGETETRTLQRSFVLIKVNNHDDIVAFLT